MLTVCLVTLGDPASLTGGYRYHRRMAELASRNNASIVFASLPRGLAFLSARRVLRAAANTDVVLIDSIAAAFLAPWIRLQRPRRLAAIVHQPPGGIDHSRPRRNVQAWLDRSVYRRCDTVMVASSLLAGHLDGSVVVPPGRDQKPGGAVRDLRGGARAAALCAANWLPNKGILDLLEAVAMLAPGTLRLHLAGDERSDTAYGRKVLRRIGDLTDRVVRHGRCDDAEMSCLYRSADIFVLPSRWETYGTVYAEAMDAGLPVVGWRCGNLPHLVKDGQQGIVLVPGDIGGLASGLRELAGDEAMRRRMGAAAADRARALPTWEQSAQQFFAVLGGLS
ncbi:MAG TPA: glycosyltransferase family 4 protein [Streptosporangiaceae bacterium]|nr:glycosyltransferase family 4 protein [Streptosporangiaceae bacterium]